MNPANLIWQQWHLQEKVFIETLEKCRHNPVKVAVHDLRVAIKKMRSFLRLQQQLTGTDWKDEFSGYSILFKSFGKLRDFDMSLYLLSKFGKTSKNKFPRFRQYLFVNRKLSRHWAIQAAILFDEKKTASLRQFFYSTFPAITDVELIAKIKEATTEKINKAQVLAAHFPKNAHEIRKLFKDIFYWMSSYPPDELISYISVESMDKMLDSLGKWQDLSILKSKIKGFKKEWLVKNEEEYDWLASLTELLSKKQEHWIDKAKKQWNSVIMNGTASST